MDVQSICVVVKLGFHLLRSTRRIDVVDDGVWIWCFLGRLDEVQKRQSSDSCVNVRWRSSVSKVWTNSKDAE